MVLQQTRGFSHYLIPPTRLGPIKQFWFGKPDTKPHWLVREVWQDTLCPYYLAFRLGRIQQFWFAEPDTEPNGVALFGLSRYIAAIRPKLALQPLLPSQVPSEGKCNDLGHAMGEYRRKLGQRAPE